MIDRIKDHLNEHISVAPLAFFRIAFGALMLISLIRFNERGWIEALYIEPEFLFSYFGFEWLPRPSATGIYILFGIAGTSSILILLGLFYRWASVLFFLSFSYIELLDKSNYLNHYYFISIVALVMIFLPANKAFSLDVKLGFTKAYGQVQRWNVALLQLLIGGLYFMAGVAKLNPDWLLDAQPLRMWLPPHNTLPVIGPLMDELWVAYLFSWFGAIYDLSIAFLLLNRRTRWIAFLSVWSFHGLTAALFPIGMFPYVMICCSLVFLPAAKLETLLTLGNRFNLVDSKSKQLKLIPNAFSTWTRGGITVLVLFLLFLFPMRFLLYPGNLFWNEQGYRFSWRVMLMEKAGHTFFYVSDPNQPGEVEINNLDYLTPNQEKQMSTQPDMMLQFAHHLESVYREKGIENPKVRVESWVTLNGQGSRLFIDPFIDLTTLEDGWGHKEWVIPYYRIISSEDLKAMKAARRE